MSQKVFEDINQYRNSLVYFFLMVIQKLQLMKLDSIQLNNICLDM